MTTYTMSALRGCAAALALLVTAGGLRAQQMGADTALRADTAMMQESGPPARRVTLDQAVTIAMQNNPALTQSRASLDQARYNRLAAYGNFLPSISAGYGYSNSSSARLDVTQQSLTRTSYSFQLSGSYDLFTGLRRFSQMKSANLNVEAQQDAYRQSRYQTLFDVKTAYFNAVANRDLVAVQAATVQRQLNQLNFVRQQLQLGRSTRSDLLSSEVNLNNAKLALLNAQNSARASTFQLAQALGVDQRVAPVAGATLEIHTLSYDRQQLQSIAQSQAPSVQSARASYQSAQAQVSSAKSAYLPNLTFSGGWAWQNTDFPPENRSWSIRLTGSIPLFNGFQRESQLFQAQAQADAAQAQERSAELALRTNIDNAYNQVQTAISGGDLAQKSVELSQENLRVTQERYRLGLATILDLQQAQINLQQAQVNLVQRKFDYQLGLAQLEALLGEPLPQAAGDAGSNASNGSRVMEKDGQ
ncbi:MAG: TolC family protein [Candidatus Palauibacterales bacterium]|nr:TolC family protein [Candidatus Palauibacterales bacterium]MDP2529671.1 TolC family protein [Candidatus Palauibacterales bacterium]